MANIIQLRRDTEANWAGANPLLADGEVGVATACTGLPAIKYKMGDGVRRWGDLDWFNDLSAYAATATTQAGVATAQASTATTQAGIATAAATTATAQKNLILNAEFDFSASGAISITYNANGTINTVSDGTTTKTCGYNAGGQLTSLT